MKIVLLMSLVFTASLYSSECSENIQEYYEQEKSDSDYVSVSRAFKVVDGLRVYEVSSEEFGGYGIDEVFVSDEKDCQVVAVENIYTE